MSLKTTLFRLTDGSAAFEMGQFQKQNALGSSAEHTDGHNSGHRGDQRHFPQIYQGAVRGNPFEKHAQNQGQKIAERVYFPQCPQRRRHIVHRRGVTGQQNERHGHGKTAEKGLLLRGRKG